jgi:methionyl aminopeptidase
VIELKSEAQIAAIQRAARIVAMVLEELRRAVRPGVATRQLDQQAEALIRKLGGRTAFKGYRGYPATICTSVNEVVVHGIPGDRALQEGDIVGLDVGAQVDGYYGDAAITVPVGAVREEATRLVRMTAEALERGIQQARAGNRISDISWAVQQHAEAHGYSVVREFTGHGIGAQLHEEPHIPNYGPPHRGPLIKEGMVLAIEPMLNLGGPEVEVLADGWTAVTRDHRWSAHFEHTVWVAGDGPRVLTMLS